MSCASVKDCVGVLGRAIDANVRTLGNRDCSTDVYLQAESGEILDTEAGVHLEPETV